MLLESEADVAVVAEAGELDEIPALVEEARPDVLLLDVHMRGGASLDLIPELAKGTQVLVLTIRTTPSTPARPCAWAPADMSSRRPRTRSCSRRCARWPTAAPTSTRPSAAGCCATTNQSLTGREREVLGLIALGHTNAEVAERLYLSLRTVETHRANIHHKLGTDSRAELVPPRTRAGAREAVSKESSRLQSIALEGAQRRVRQDLASTGEGRGRLPRWAVLAAALVLFIGAFVLRLVVNDPAPLIANFYAVPIALVAMVFGIRAGLAAAAFAVGLVWAWGQIKDQHVSLLGYSTRTAVFVLVGALVGYYAERLRRDIAERRHAEAELEIRAHDLEVSNTQLTSR